MSSFGWWLVDIIEKINLYSTLFLSSTTWYPCLVVWCVTHTSWPACCRSLLSSGAWYRVCSGLVHQPWRFFCAAKGDVWDHHGVFFRESSIWNHTKPQNWEKILIPWSKNSDSHWWSAIQAGKIAISMSNWWLITHRIHGAGIHIYIYMLTLGVYWW